MLETSEIILYASFLFCPLLKLDGNIYTFLTKEDNYCSSFTLF